MTEEIKKMTYENMYKELKFKIPFENLMPVTVTLPEKLINIINLNYQLEIETEHIDMTFEEFLGTAILLGINCSDKL